MCLSRDFPTYEADWQLLYVVTHWTARSHDTYSQHEPVSRYRFKKRKIPKENMTLFFSPIYVQRPETNANAHLVLIWETTYGFLPSFLPSGRNNSFRRGEGERMVAWPSTLWQHPSDSLSPPAPGRFLPIRASCGRWMPVGALTHSLALSSSFFPSFAHFPHLHGCQETERESERAIAAQSKADRLAMQTKAMYYVFNLCEKYVEQRIIIPLQHYSENLDT